MINRRGIETFEMTEFLECGQSLLKLIGKK